MRHRAPSLSAFNKRPAKASAFAESISGFFVESDIPSILRTYIADANANFRKVAEARISWLMRCLSRRRRLDDRQILLSKHRDGLCQIGSRSLQVCPGPEFRSYFQLYRINTAATMTAVGLHDIATHIALFFVVLRGRGHNPVSLPLQLVEDAFRSGKCFQAEALSQ